MEIILHNNGAFNIYSTVTECTHFKSAITEAELRAWIKEEYGNFGLRLADERIARAVENGSEGFGSRSKIESCIEYNYADMSSDPPGRLSYEEFVKRYLTLEKQ